MEAALCSSVDSDLSRFDHVKLYDFAVCDAAEELARVVLLDGSLGSETPR